MPDASAFAAHMPVIDGYPRPDWLAIARLIPEEQPEHAHEHWCAVARAWMDATAEHLGAPYKVIETTNFLILSPLEVRTDRLLQGFVEKAWKQILSLSSGVFLKAEYGHTAIPFYDLSETEATLAHELTPFIEFTRHANFADGGEAAAVEVFGGSLGGLIEQFFGPGDWSPRTTLATSGGSV